ncbi:MAG: hypothetical protein JXR10_14020 [Cyclobacteriaceae bacterium]
MNRILTLTAVAAMTFLYSCGDDDTETPAPALPTISVATTVNGTAATSPADVVPGDTVVFSITIDAAGGFNTYRLYSSIDGGTATQISDNTRTILEVAVGTTTVTDALRTIISADNVGSTITSEFEVVDDAGQTGTTSVDLVVGSPAIVTHTQTMLFGQSNAGGGSFYDAVLDVVYGASDAFQVENQDDIDFVFWYGGTSGYAIGATDDATAVTAFNAATSPVNLENLQTRNSTKFKGLSAMNAAAFDAISNETELLNAYGEVAATDSNIIGLDPDDSMSKNVFAFVLAGDRGSKVGLAKVISTDDGTGGGAARTITIMVKIQE